MRPLRPRPLTSEAFAPYGDVIAAGGGEHRAINYGATTRFHDLAALDVTGDDGQPLVSIFRSSPLPTPLTLKVMERHPLSSQAFMPLDGRPYLVVVAPPGDFDIARVEAFLAGPGQGVNYHRGTWHHFSLALGEPSDFLVIDRGGPGENLDEIFLAEADWLAVDV